MSALLRGIGKVAGLTLVLVMAVVTVGILALAWVGLRAGQAPELDATSVPVLVPEVLAEHPRSPDAFTQGLELTPDGRLLESTGGYDTSVIRLVDPAQDTVSAQIELPGDQFGEGVTLVTDRDTLTAIQLTWKAGLAHRWTLTDSGGLEYTAQHSYDGEGWGLCHDVDADVLWRSDGSETLTAHDPVTFAETGTSVRVTLQKEAVTRLNELECTTGGIWANVWQTSDIVLIDPGSGEVKALVDASTLVQRANELAGGLGHEEVLNGIAYDEVGGNWYLTGKNWPVIFEVELSDAG